MNQFHYGMNQVLDGMGTPDQPSPDTPDFPDKDSFAGNGPDELPLPGKVFAKHPNTVYLFDIAPNSPGGSPRQVATENWRDWEGRTLAKFHGDYANLLYLHGGVTHCKAADLVSAGDNLRGGIIWDHPRLYWGYRPPRRTTR
jgi:hypothetical protein